VENALHQNKLIIGLLIISHGCELIQLLKMPMMEIDFVSEKYMGDEAGDGLS
jgi:hypothetical protein